VFVRGAGDVALLTRHTSHQLSQLHHSLRQLVRVCRSLRCARVHTPSACATRRRKVTGCDSQLHRGQWRMPGRARTLTPAESCAPGLHGGSLGEHTQDGGEVWKVLQRRHSALAPTTAAHWEVSCSLPQRMTRRSGQEATRGVARVAWHWIGEGEPPSGARRTRTIENRGVRVCKRRHVAAVRWGCRHRYPSIRCPPADSCVTQPRQRARRGERVACCCRRWHRYICGAQHAWSGAGGVVLPLTSTSARRLS